MKTDRSVIEEFIRQKNIAVVGVSSNPKKFGSYIFKELSGRGFSVIPVNPKMEKFESSTCYKNLREIPGKVDGVIVVVPPDQTESVIKDAAAAGIKRIWFQQGSESSSAVDLCGAHGLQAVAGKCIMMFAPPVSSIHRIHRFLWNIFHR